MSRVTCNHCKHQTAADEDGYCMICGHPAIDIPRPTLPLEEEEKSTSQPQNILPPRKEDDPPIPDKPQGRNGYRCGPKQMSMYYLENRPKIRLSYEQLGFMETRRIWQMNRMTLTKMIREWESEELVGKYCPVLAGKQ